MHSVPGKIAFSDIVAESKKLGLELVSSCSTEELAFDRDKLINWQSNGFSAEMKFMQREAELLSSPLRIMPEVKSILTFAVYYERRPVPDFIRGYGKVARYAWGKDYHKVLRKKLDSLMTNLSQAYGRQISYRAFSDAVPLMERALARKAGMGFIGKNSMLIKPRSGSYFFIAEILIDAEITESPLSIIEENCGSCSNCKSACPTKAIVDDYTINANLCISYLTIEKKGVLSYAERKGIGQWVFGCDVCQEVCPFNHKSLKSEALPSLEEFKKEYGAGPLLNLEEVLSIKTKEAYIENFGGTALMRAGRESLLRNASVVAANTISEDTLPALRVAFLEDSSEIVRAHAFWAISEIQKHAAAMAPESYGILVDKARTDCQLVKDELGFSHV